MSEAAAPTVAGPPAEAARASATAARERSEPATSSTAGSELVQLLTPEGERVSHPDYDVDLTDDEYRALYRDLVLVRRIDVEATALQRQGELGIWAALLGQEAAQVGSGRALRPTDMAFPTYREHGVAWCKDVDPLQLLGLFRGASNGGWDPHERRFNLYTIVIGSQTLHATGYAMGVAMEGAVGGDDGEAVIAYFGDGASSQGDVNEAFVWAAVYQSPIVFFCQNNQWGISTPSDHQSRIPLYKRAEGFGFPGVRVDGNDVLASYAVTKKALDAARHGQGPTLVEAFTYRMGAHTTSDDPTRYRLASELEAWKLKDPLERMKSFLYKQQLVDSDFFGSLEEEADALAARLRKGCLEMPDPPPSSMFEHVYAEPSPLLDLQQQQFDDYMAGFADEPVGGQH
jgi:2-oxoisovalerate dehydrogenase E1 component alpha subunit